MVQMLIRRTSIVASVLALSLILVIQGWAGAVEGKQHIAATPSSADLSIAPGASASDSLAIINQGTDSFKVKTSVAPYHVEGINYDPQFTQLPGTVDPSKWVTLTVPQNTTLAPDKLLHIDYTVNVPAGTAPGGYYAVIFAETMPAGQASGVVAHNRIGEILYLTVKGEVETKGTAHGGKIDRFNMSGKLSIPILVSNSGGVHFKTTVTTTIKNVFGKKVYSHHEDRYVLPQTQRQIVQNWQNQVPLGIYKVSRQATVPNGSVQLPDQTVIMVQPWLLIIVFLVAVAITPTFIGWLRGRRKHR